MLSHRPLVAATLVLFSALAAGAPPAAPESLTADQSAEIARAALAPLDPSVLELSTAMLGQIDIPPRHPWLARILSPIAHARPFHHDCPRGGSVKGKLADRDRSEDLSERDRFVTTFSDCRFDAGDPVSGRSECVVREHRLDGSLDVTLLACQFQALGTPALRWTGPVEVLVQTDLRSGAEHRVTTFRDLAVQRDGAPTYRWTLVVDMQYSPLGDHTGTINGTLAAPGLGPLALAQETPFVVDKDGSARSGRLLVTSPRGSRIRVEVMGASQTISYFGKDNPGDVPDAESVREIQAR